MTGPRETNDARGANVLDIVEIAELIAIVVAAEGWVLSPADGYKADRRRALERVAEAQAGRKAAA